MATARSFRLGVVRDIAASALLGLVLLPGLVLMSGGEPLCAADPAADESQGEEIREVTRTSAMETLLARTLSAETALKAPDHTLSRALRMLADRHGINIVLLS